MKKIIYILFLAMFFSSCTDIFSEKLLEQAPDEDITEEKIFTQYALFRQYADYNYSYVVGHYSQLFNAMQAGISDELVTPKPEASTKVIQTGAWNGAVPRNNNEAQIAVETIYPWRDSYKGIRTSNLIIKNIDRVTDFPSETIKKRYLGEAYYLRAMFYFQLLKRYGGVPIVLEPLTLGDNLDLARNTYEECVNRIVEDCDTAAGLLGLKYDDADNGRATIGAARALKARTLLYAARPLNNPENDKSKWERARNAAMDVIEMNQYSLYPDYKNLFYQAVCEEIILNRPRPRLTFDQGNTDNSHFFVRFIATQGYNGWQGACPTQNLVDKFEDKDGYPIAESTIYNDQNPYANRDPRLDMVVLRDGRYWYNRETEYWVQLNAEGKESTIGRDRGATHTTPTGYSIAKLWPESHQRYQGTTTYLNYIFFRYAEVLLNFAEAQNEVGGPESSYKGLSVRSAVNQVRKRAGHVDIPTSVSNSTEKMRARLMDERAVELAFEDHRWYDILTWKKGVEYLNTRMKGMYIVKNADGSKTYSIVNAESNSRVFEEHMHRYPIPQTELDKSVNLVQNPGW